MDKPSGEQRGVPLHLSWSGRQALQSADVRHRYNWVLELHQIDENPSTFREFINKHGQGVHHLGFEVGDARDEVIRELKEMGFDTERTIGVYPGSSWTIVDSEDVLGVNLNIKPKR